MDRGKRTLALTAFIGGLVSLSLELTAARLLAPTFGTSEPVWSAIIGLILLYLSVGYVLGGRWADRDPRRERLALLLLAAGMGIALIPFAARPVLHLAARGMASLEVGLTVGPFIAVLILFALPVTLLACVSPFVIRLSVGSVQDSGRTAGRIYAISTAGSFLGAFLPNLLLVPHLGVQRTFLLLALLTYGIGLLGLREAKAEHFWLFFWLGLALVGMMLLPPSSPRPPTTQVPQPARLLYEGDSVYNFIQVVEDAQGTRYLLLNEGEGVHSIYNPDRLLTGGTWDFFLVAPCFAPPPRTPQQVEQVLVIGLAAGTIPRQFTALYGPIEIDGVEIDPTIVEVGRRYFGMTEPNLHVHIGDGRAFLHETSKRYDLIAVDAYRLPYIPWHLTTVEFFQEVRAHLDAEGVVAINVGHTPEDWRLVSAMAATMGEVFPSVHAVAVPHTFNAIVIGSMQPTTWEDFAQNAAELSPPLATIAQRAEANRLTLPPSDLRFTDDRAPVEALTHRLIVDYLLGRRPAQ